MKVLIVYDSIYGNTEKIAQAIGDTLKVQADVQVLRTGEVKPEHLEGVSLLVAGTPTHGAMVSQATTAWLKTLARNSLRGVKVAAFDTRMPVDSIRPAIARFFVKRFGYAAPRLAGSLTKLGGALAVPAEGFNVKDTEGPLAEGELERAKAWGARLAQAVHVATT